MQSLSVPTPAFIMTCAALARVATVQGPAEMRRAPHAPGESPHLKNVERQRGDYVSTLEWLRERQACLRREGYRVHRTTFRARGSRWVSRIVYVRAPEIGSS